MKYLMNWLRERKLHSLKIKLAGRKAAMAELRRAGEGNWGIAEDIGMLEYQIAELESKINTFRLKSHARLRVRE